MAEEDKDKFGPQAIERISALVNDNKSISGIIEKLGKGSDHSTKISDAMEKQLLQITAEQGRVVDKMSLVTQVANDIKEKANKMSYLQNELKQALTNTTFLQNCVSEEMTEMQKYLKSGKSSLISLVDEFKKTSKELFHAGILQNELILNFSDFKRTVLDELTAVKAEMSDINSFLKEDLPQKIIDAFASQPATVESKPEKDDHSQEEQLKFTLSEEEIPPSGGILNAKKPQGAEAPQQSQAEATTIKSETVQAEVEAKPKATEDSKEMPPEGREQAKKPSSEATAAPEVKNGKSNGTNGSEASVISKNSNENDKISEKEKASVEPREEKVDTITSASEEGKKQSQPK